jgi:LysR family hydrogen peroxide-inducible transcriptional activator
MLQRLHANELDVGILALPVELDGLASQTLYEEPFVVALPARHELAKRETLQARDLQDQTLLLLEEGHCLRDQALDVCGRVRIREHQDFRGTSIETLRQMVANGAGITLLPQSACRGAYASTRGVSIRPLASPAPVRTIGAVWRKSSARLAAIEEVCKLLRKR